jgi:hypothetical protein
MEKKTSSSEILWKYKRLQKLRKTLKQLTLIKNNYELTFSAREDWII